MSASTFAGGPLKCRWGAVPPVLRRSPNVGCTSLSGSFDASSVGLTPRYTCRRPRPAMAALEETRMDLGAFSVSLAVQDLEASRRFYEKLGFVSFLGDAS